MFSNSIAIRGVAIDFTSHSIAIKGVAINFPNHSIRIGSVAIEFPSHSIAIGRVAIEFHSHSSPLGVVPKKEPGKFRLIHDLSFPRKPPNSSVNDGIDPIDATVSYETLDEVIALLHRAGKGALMAKVDIENAFRIIPIHPSN